VKILTLALTTAGCLAIAGAAWAGAWSQPEGSYYAKLAVSRFAATADFDSDSNKLDKLGNGRLTDLSVTTYLEYGLRERLTLVASFPFKRLEDERTFTTGIGNKRDTDFGDLDLRLRYQWWDTPIVAAVAGGVRLPLTYEVGEQSNVPLGTGRWAQEIRLLAGRSLYPFPGYLTGDLGWRHRSGRFSDELFYSLEAGASRKRVLLKATVAAIHTLGTCGALTQAGLIGDQDVLKVSPGLIYRATERLELSLEAFHIAAGCNTTAGTTWSLGAALTR